VYTIGMSAAPATVETNDQLKGKKNPAADFLDEALLQKIANETGGKYFRARDKDGLKNIYGQIDKLEKSKVEVSAITRYTEKFFPFVMAALAFLLIEAVLRFTVFKKFP